MPQKTLQQFLRNEDGAILIMAAPSILCLVIIILGIVNVGYAYRQQNIIESIAQNAAVAACSHLPWEHYDMGGNTPAEMVSYAVTTGSPLLYGKASGTLTYQDENSVTVTVTAPGFSLYNAAMGYTSGSISATYSATRIQSRLDSKNRPIYEYRTQIGAINQ